MEVPSNSSMTAKSQWGVNKNRTHKFYKTSIHNIIIFKISTVQEVIATQIDISCDESRFL